MVNDYLLNATIIPELDKELGRNREQDRASGDAYVWSADVSVGSAQGPTTNTRIIDCN